MASQDSAAMAGSKLRPPTKLKLSPSKGLADFSASVGNSRLPPPGMMSIKHKPTGLPEPPMKRKTLAERAGETSSQKDTGFASSLPVSDPFRTTSTSTQRSGATSLSRAASVTSTRHASTLASSSGGTGIKPPTTNAAKYKRPGTSHGHARSSTQPHNTIKRPVTAASNYRQPKSPKQNAFDPEERIRSMESMWTTHLEEFKSTMQKSISDRSSIDEITTLYKAKIADLEEMRKELKELNAELKEELEEVKAQLANANNELEDLRRRHSFEVDDLRRQLRNDVEDLKDQHRRQLDRERQDSERAAEKVAKEFEEQIENLLKAQKDELIQSEKRLKEELEEERKKRVREVQELSSQHILKLQSTGLDLDNLRREADNFRSERDHFQSALDREKAVREVLEKKMAEAAANNIALETTNREMKAKIDFLESDNQQQSAEYANLHKRMQEALDAAALAQEKLRAEETLRRKLHNQVQELRGNIRVMCRVRPPLPKGETQPAKISFPDAGVDCKEVAIMGPEKTSLMGNVTAATNAFSFDRVFGPGSQNAEVFDEISQLVQSALDGYNVCIFCYGQTGSGKTFTMSSADGMIPRATAQIYDEAQRLEEKGWNYTMEGSFVEVYNETLNDLLGKADELDKKKLEIRHDPAKKQTAILGAATVPLDSPDRVQEILKRADSNRIVAATKANERSSRSHSVFILKLFGENNITGERSEGTLNLVDLAGSERISHSGATGDRLKEAQNINKSLSCLGDVIAALGSGKEGAHIPYRNSKLTYLLQYSLGGNSKTLMFVMVSPLQAHLSETLTSLKFATKVHNTHIGTAKRQSKVKD